MTLTAPELSAVCTAAIPLLYILLMALGRMLKRRAGVQLQFTYRCLCGVVAIYIPTAVLHLQFPDLGFDLGHALEAMTVLLGAFVVMALMRRYLWELYFEQNQKVRIPKLLRQLASIFVFLTACLLVLLLYKQGGVVRSFITGSSVIAVILGFAMQNLLGNIIAGIALEIGKPFKPGDWIKADGEYAEVIEVNWRSTRLRTPDDVCLDIPNSEIVSHNIVNVSFPTPRHAIRVTVGVDYAVPPNVVKEILVKAASSAFCVLETPVPKAYLKDFGDSAIVYEVKFWTENEEFRNDILDSVRTNIWYALHRHSIQIPYPIRTVQLEKQPKQSKPVVHNRISHGALRVKPFFQCLNEEETQRLICGARMLRFGRGEKIIVQGDEGHSMFVLIHGSAGVFVQKENSPAHQIAKLHTGDYFGEMSLLTGEPRTATIIAQADCEVLEIDKTAFAEIIAINPALLDRLSEVLSQRRLELEGVLASKSETKRIDTLQKEYSANLLKRIYSFFEL